MSGGVAPLASISLRDGTQLQVAADGVHHDNQVIPLSKIQDARQVSPSPEAIALRVSGMGLLEFEPEHSGDGAAALEALFQLRPDLRPAGFGAPVGEPPAGYPGIQSYGSAGMKPGSPTASLPSPEVGYAEVGAMAERRARGLLTPFPRGFFEIVAAIFQLYGSKLRFWLLLGLLVVPVAGILDAGASYLLFSRVVQPSSTTTALSSSSCSLPAFQFETGASLLRDTVGAGVLLLLSLLVTAFQTALMGIAARDAALDRPVSVRQSFASALRRWRPTLGATFVAGSAYYLVLVPALASYGYVYATASGLNLCAATGATTTALSVGCLGSVFLVIGIVLAILMAVRLGFAPYVAATSHANARQAIARSWQLTRGHFWRAFGIIVLTGTAAWLVLQIASSFPPAIAVFVATPIAYLFTVPFIALTYTVLLYDLWLRHDGYAALTQELSTVPSTPPASVPPLG
ncbi:MAG: glycerophosphoryl diester phosphodiesterase membrane domain-containing protein [Ktedonobacterales bacterium]